MVAAAGRIAAHRGAMAYLRLRRVLELAVLDRPGFALVVGVTQWLSRRPLSPWRPLKTQAGVLDEAVVMAPWGGAWQVWTCRPKGVADG